MCVCTFLRRVILCYDLKKFGFWVYRFLCVDGQVEGDS